MPASLALPRPISEKKTDRLGIIASALCAVHCAVTPILLIVMPAFGKVWSHPASHWVMALVVVPIALLMMTSGYRRHRRKWIIATGAAGIAFILVGAAIPYVDPSENSTVEAAAVVAESEAEASAVTAETSAVTSEPSSETPGASGDATAAVAAVSAESGEEIEETACVDECCPSLVADEEGKLRLNVPPASIVTMLGGVALIVTHVGNLCCCPGCRREEKSQDKG